MVPDGCLWHLRLLDLECNAAIDWRSLESVWFLPKYGSSCDMRMRVLIFRRLTVELLKRRPISIFLCSYVPFYQFVGKIPVPELLAHEREDDINI